MKDPVRHSQLRTVQYWYADGTFELGFGLLCFLLGIYLYFENLLQGTWLTALADILLIVVVIGGSFLMNWLIRNWKERVTYPRTGYVNYAKKHNRAQTILMGVIVLSALGLMVYFLSRVEIQISTRPLVTGILFGIVMIFVGWRTLLRRFYLHTLLSMLVGIGLAFSPWDNHVGLAAFYSGIGLILIVSGVLTLRAYLRQNPVQKESPDEQ